MVLLITKLLNLHDLILCRNSDHIPVADGKVKWLPYQTEL